MHADCDIPVYYVLLWTQVSLLLPYRGEYKLIWSYLRHGTKSMLWYIAVCSMIGGISVSVTTGLGAAIVTTAQGDNQVRLLLLFCSFCAHANHSLSTGSSTSCLCLWQLL